MTYIFGIGLSKTGTTSLTNALNMLGIPSLHYPSPSKFRARDPEMFRDYRAFTDINVTDEWEKLYEEFPGSKFILTVRNAEEWLSSCDHAFGGEMEEYMRNRYGEGLSAQIHKRIYLDWGFDESRFRQIYTVHNSKVLRHFMDKPDQFLIFDCRDGWHNLCAFVERPIPDKPFPHSNKRRPRK